MMMIRSDDGDKGDIDSGDDDDDDDDEDGGDVLNAAVVQ